MYKLNDDNRNEYIIKIQKYLNLYLLEGTPSFKSEEIINFFGLENDELNVLKAVHFLISPEVSDLFIHIPNLFRNMSHSTVKDDLEYHGCIPGNINWDKTIKIRYSKGFNDKSLFICSTPFNHYDLDENRILKFIFKKIINLYEIVLRFDNSKEESNIDFNNLYQNSEKWYDLVEEKYLLSKLAIHNIYFMGVSNLDFVSVESLEKVKNHRNPIYHNVARVFELYEKLFIFDDIGCLKDLVRNQLIIASNNDTLFEIYIFFKLIAKLEEKSINDSFKIHINFKNYQTDEQVSADLDDNLTIKIFYQHVPTTFKSNSKYLKMNKNKQYGLNKGIRRPDIIFEIIKNGNHIYRIIEVKNSSDSRYMRNSFYKMFGYIYDFSDVNFTRDIPFILVNWNGTEINEKFKEEIYGQRLIFFNKNEFLNNMDLLFKI
jgi:hypothetical protein